MSVGLCQHPDVAMAEQVGDLWERGAVGDKREAAEWRSSLGERCPTPARLA